MANKGFLNFTIIDFETSGLDARNEQIIEAMVIRVRNGNPVMTFNTLVALRENKTLVPKISELTGHYAEDLEGAISEAELAGTLNWLISPDELLIAHNALFDLDFLNQLFRQNKLIHPQEDIENPFIDTLTIARAREPFPHKLEDVCKRNGIVLDDAHSAEADCLALLEVVLKYHRDKDIYEWLNVAGYRPKYGEPSWYPEHAILKKQGAEKVQHGLKPVAAPITTVGKRTTSNRKKKVPGDKDEMPSALLPKEVKFLIDGYIQAKMEHWEVAVPNEDFDSTWAYVTKVLKLPESQLDNYADNPAEACIEYNIHGFGK